MTASLPSTLLITCGALAREVTALIEANGWRNITVTCLPAVLHNRPREIPERVRAKIRRARGRYDRILVLYADCGTGGVLDAVLEEEGVERIEGAHCYQFYAGTADFEALAEAEPGTFFLTDYLVRHFDLLIIRGLGLDRYPQLLSDYFGNYRKLVHLAQIEDAGLKARAESAAKRLGLAFEYRFTGMGGIEAFLETAASLDEDDGDADRRLSA